MENDAYKSLTEPFVNKEIKGRTCRVRREQKTTLFIGSLPKSLTTEEVRQELTNILGEVPFELEMKFGPPPLSEPRGFGFATFPSYRVAEKARKTLSNASIGERNVVVSWAEPMDEPDDHVMQSVKTLFINNISISVVDSTLYSLCSQFGPIIHSAIVKNQATQESKGFAFVEYNVRDDCLKALQSLNGYNLEGQNLKVVLAKPQSNEKTNKGHMAKECPNPTPPGSFPHYGHHNQTQNQRGRGRGRGLSLVGGSSPGPARKMMRGGMNNNVHTNNNNNIGNPVNNNRGAHTRGGAFRGRGAPRGRGGSNDNSNNYNNNAHNKGGANYYNNYDPSSFSDGYNYQQYSGYQQGYQQQQGYASQQYPQGYQQGYAQNYNQPQQQYYSQTGATQYNGPTSDYNGYPQQTGSLQGQYHQGSGSASGVRYNPY